MAVVGAPQNQNGDISEFPCHWQKNHLVTKFFFLIPIYPDIIQYFLSKILNKSQQGIDMVRLWSLFGLKPFNGKQRTKRLICKKVFPMAVKLEPGFKSLCILIQHGYTFYWNGVCIQPGDKKSTEQQIKILFNDYRISSCVIFEYLPLNIRLQSL